MKSASVIVPLLLVLWLLPGCGRREAEPETEGKSSTESGGTIFEEEKGLKISSEARDAMDLKTAQAVRMPLTPELKIEAQVYRAASEKVYPTTREKGGHSYASATVPTAQASGLREGQDCCLKVSDATAFQGILTQIDRATEQLNGQVELLFEIADPSQKLAHGTAVKAYLKGQVVKSALATPRSAVLQTAGGTFVYEARGEWYRRTPVRTGAEQDQFVEILDGLQENDTIVDRGAEKLWLVELRFVRGGGDTD